MTTSLKSLGAMTLFVEDVARSTSFYQKAFGAPIVYQDESSAVFGFDNVLVNLLAVSEAGGLIEPAAVAGRGAGSSCQLTVWVDDADAVCAQLAELGVALLNGPIDREWGKRTACFADPDGHVWEIAQDIA
jgi:catechol 2,3-dioxygenase-like lactoylglutathione lyase family enzyme